MSNRNPRSNGRGGCQYRIMPSYVGSKRRWLKELSPLVSGRDVVELFAGSGVISANLARSSWLNDQDAVVARILNRFDEMIVPRVFTRADYYRVRSLPQWWQWIYCLQSISFSGVFRYSKNGYNVPAKGGPDEAKNAVNEWRLRPSYERDLQRWQELDPFVTNLDYEQALYHHSPPDDAVVIFDPPYEGSKAAYNSHFDYRRYWAVVKSVSRSHDVVVFDTYDNLLSAGLKVSGSKKMRVNGARAGNTESIHVNFCEATDG